MQFLSGGFVILWVICFALYYLVPAGCQWAILAAASGLFYVAGLRGLPLGLLLTGAGAYACGRYLERSLSAQAEALQSCQGKEEKKAKKQAFERRRRLAQTLYFVFALGLLLGMRRLPLLLPFLRDTGRSPWQDALSAGFLMPLGISFYTLAAIGYVVDVGREHCAAERNPVKLFLFLSYFPAITQGPINRYGKLREEFLRPHAFSYERMLFGLQRFVWGTLKKLVIADRLGMFVGNVFDGGGAGVPGGIYALATFFYMLQLYADFSGYMDMALGISETFGIVLPENFKRPYFSKSVAEFWRRWHITLGAWFKDYVMFSFVMSDAGRRLSKAAKKRWPGAGKQAVALLGTMLVWLLTGLWHSQSVNYLLWGVYYGIIMCLSLLLEPMYSAWKKQFGKALAFLCMARTWLIVFVADVLIRSKSLTQAGQIYLSFFRGFNIVKTLTTLTDYGLHRDDFLLLLVVLALWLLVSVCEERGGDVRGRIAAFPLPFRWGVYYGAVLILLVTGIYGGGYDTAVFLYQSF